MPWKIQKRDGKHCVVPENGGEAAGCHSTRDEAVRQLKALYANEVTAAMEAPTSDSLPPMVGSPIAAGIALMSGETGRVLMIQRALIDGEAAGGKWEFPGGNLDDGEDTFAGAAREFAEETGHPLPDGDVAGTWISGNGVYRGFILVCSCEEDFPLHETDPVNRAVDNPDNPDGSNYTESIAWFDPADLMRGPKILREEVKSTPWKLIKSAAPAGRDSLMAAMQDLNVTIDEAALSSAIRAAIHVGPPKEDAPNRDFDSLVAALAAPVAAFLPEEELPGPTPFTLADDGTHDGHLALWASCHIGFPGCVKPPLEESFDFYNLGDAVTADGRHVPVGKVTIGCGHAGPDLNWRTAAAHYDNSGTTAGVAHAVKDRWGIRLPGSVVADISGAQVDELRRSPLSGDWRRINNRLRLVASLGVNVPGYPVPRALTAGGEVQAMFVGFNPEDMAAAQLEADELAAELGLDPASRAAAIRASITK